MLIRVHPWLKQFPFDWHGPNQSGAFVADVVHFVADGAKIQLRVDDWELRAAIIQSAVELVVADDERHPVVDGRDTGIFSLSTVAVLDQNNVKLHLEIYLTIQKSAMDDILFDRVVGLCSDCSGALGSCQRRLWRPRRIDAGQQCLVFRDAKGLDRLE